MLWELHALLCYFVIVIDDMVLFFVFQKLVLTVTWVLIATGTDSVHK